MARATATHLGQSRLAAELARLGSMTPAELRAEWATTIGTPAPSLATGLLRRLLAQRIQEKRLGALPVMVVRELERTAREGVVPTPVPATVTVSPGARLIREWQGRTIAVLATEEGFVWEERTYRSLSQIAREVTGAHWSGPRFFGLTRRG
ncbi:MAG: DUF2924 domain-containing protein [Rhizorhabdus sp.]